MANLNNECSCKGENPNCYKCGGNGVYSVEVSDNKKQNLNSSFHDISTSKSKQSYNKNKALNPSSIIFEIKKITKERYINDVDEEVCPICHGIYTSMNKHLVKCLKNRDINNLDKILQKLQNASKAYKQQKEEDTKTETIVTNQKPLIYIKNQLFKKYSVACNLESLVLKRHINSQSNPNKLNEELLLNSIKCEKFVKLFQNNVCFFCKSSFSELTSHLFSCKILKHLTTKETHHIFRDIVASDKNFSVERLVPITKDVKRQEIIKKLYLKEGMFLNHFHCPFCIQSIQNIDIHVKTCIVFKYAPTTVLYMMLERKWQPKGVYKSQLTNPKENQKSHKEKFNYKKQDKVEGVMDASKDFFTFREQGRFGSHPVHDDYGEEGEV